MRRAPCLPLLLLPLLLAPARAQDARAEVERLRAEVNRLQDQRITEARRNDDRLRRLQDEKERLQREVAELRLRLAQGGKQDEAKPEPPAAKPEPPAAGVDPEEAERERRFQRVLATLDLGDTPLVDALRLVAVLSDFEVQPDPELAQVAERLVVTLRTRRLPMSTTLDLLAWNTWNDEGEPVALAWKREGKVIRFSLAPVEESQDHQEH